MIGFIERKITLELCGTGVQTRVRARQGDSLVHKIIVNFTRYGRACFPADTVMAEVRGVLPNGKIISADAVIDNGERCAFTPGTAFFECGGSVICNLILRGSDGGELCAPAFAIDVEPSSAAADEVSEGETYSRIAELLSEVLAEKSNLGEKLDEKISAMKSELEEKLSDTVIVDGTKTSIDTRDYVLIYDTREGKYLKVQWTQFRQAMRSFLEGNMSAIALVDADSGYTAELPELEDDSVIALQKDIEDLPFEEWRFVLENGTSVTKRVMIK